MKGRGQGDETPTCVDRTTRIVPCLGSPRGRAAVGVVSRTARDLPWRRTTDPYAILVSEVMLQQTQVERVVPRYLAWLERWPTVEALAAAAIPDVLREWQGLGYNRRALNLHRAATAIAERGWPSDLTELPGVGDYTAAAIRNFAFGDDVLPVDTNVSRVQERTGHSFDARERAGADGSRRDRLPCARPSLRHLPAGGGLSVARPPLRAAAQAVAVRGLVPPASRTCAARDPRRRAAGRRRGRRRARTRRARERNRLRPMTTRYDELIERLRDRVATGAPGAARVRDVSREGAPARVQGHGRGRSGAQGCGLLRGSDLRAHRLAAVAAGFERLDAGLGAL